MGTSGGDSSRVLTNKQISVSDSKVEGQVVQLIRAWATAFPGELVALQRKVRAFRSGLFHSNAMTREREMLHKAEIPAKIHAAMCRVFGHEWLYDARLREMFFRNFRVGLVNRTSVQRTDKR